MPVPAAVRARCRALLPPGEDLRYILPATSASSPETASFLIVITDRSICVLSTLPTLSPLSATFSDQALLTSVHATHARRTRLGPVESPRALPSSSGAWCSRSTRSTRR
ncbi:hypothetical protein ACFQX6_23820 [Streptosporangium lutulentum]